MKVSKHAQLRLSDRSNLTYADIANVVRNYMYIPIGRDLSKESHLLFYWPHDDAYFVIIQGEDGTVITVMTDVQHQNQNRFIIDFANRVAAKELYNPAVKALAESKTFAVGIQNQPKTNWKFKLQLTIVDPTKEPKVQPKFITFSMCKVDFPDVLDISVEDYFTAMHKKAVLCNPTSTINDFNVAGGEIKKFYKVIEKIKEAHKLVLARSKHV